ncbi:c-type cytochrome [Paraburkholderia sp. Se-20369]|nr:c-type cytochrome [Paraburkholderia sp. Se-20369]
MVAGFLTNPAASGHALAADDCSPQLGQHVFETKCAMCHAVDKAKGTIVGPNLSGVFGRPVGKLPGFGYSRTLAASDGSWTEQALDLFLKTPAVAKPGNAMPFTGLRNDAERAAAICYLKQQR